MPATYAWVLTSVSAATRALRAEAQRKSHPHARSARALSADFVFFLSYRGVLPASSEERLILPSVCTRQQASFARRQLLPLGLQGEDARVPPPALAARGVDAAAWAEAARRLRDEVLPLQGPVDRPDCLGSPRLFDFMPAFISMCTPLVLLMLPFYPLAALYDARRAARFQRALGGWLDDLNARLLRPVGCFARLQTSVVVIPGVIPGFYRYRGERIGDQPVRNQRRSAARCVCVTPHHASRRRTCGAAGSLSARQRRTQRSCARSACGTAATGGRRVCCSRRRACWPSTRSSPAPAAA